MKAKGLSLMSGGLDSQLAVRVLQEAGAEVEGVCFETPFFSSAAARRAAAALGVKLHVIDFTEDECRLIENPPHGFGGAMNPCIDCHATMIRRAGELMASLGYDFVATGEVLNQRPMSQNRQSLGVVAKTSGLEGRLVRPLCAQLLDPTIPEQEGKLDRSKLLGLSGRRREPQFELAKKYGVVDYPSPAGGCKLTEKGFGHRLKDLLDHEGLGNRRLVELLLIARRFRFPDGTGVILGRDASENATLKECGYLGTLVYPVNCPGPTALVPGATGKMPVVPVGTPGATGKMPVVPVGTPSATGKMPVVPVETSPSVTGEALMKVAALVAAWSKHDQLQTAIVTNVGEVPPPYDRAPFLPYQIL